MNEVLTSLEPSNDTNTDFPTAGEAFAKGDPWACWSIYLISWESS